MKSVQGRAMALLLACAGTGAAHAAPAADALQRPALAARAPQRAVLLAAAWAGSKVVAVGERGIVATSGDGGRTWQQRPTPVSVSLTAVRFADPANGVAVGHGGLVLVTGDGGSTWTVRFDGLRAAQLALDAARRAGDDTQLKAARRLVDDGPDKPFFDVIVFDSRRMLIVGAYGLAFQTEDAGQSWASLSERLENPKALHIYAARRAGDAVLLAGEQGLLLLSQDGGKSFRRLASPYKGSWFTAELPTAGDIVVAGLRGNAWRSADGGASWTQIPVPLQASITASAIGADGVLILANQAGSVMRARGGSVEPLNEQPLPAVSGLLAGKDGSLFALGLGGVLPVAGGPK